MDVKIYDYWRSSASYRLRIALHLKGVDFETEQIDLHPDRKQHKSEAYRTLNPQMRVPAIALDGEVIGQSMAILEWIEETWPTPSILPSDSVARLKARAFSDTIACDVHPLNNPVVLNTLKSDFQASPDSVSAWYAKWIQLGFEALEARYGGSDTAFLFADYPTIAEICLVPQMYNARRFSVDLSAFPKLVEIDAKCQSLTQFRAAWPEANKPA